MAWVERRVTRTTQPQDACGLDTNHPLFSKINLAWTPKSQIFVAGQSGKGVQSSTAAPTIAPGQRGVFENKGQNGIEIPVSRVQTNSGFSVLYIGGHSSADWSVCLETSSGVFRRWGGVYSLVTPSGRRSVSNAPIPSGAVVVAGMLNTAIYRMVVNGASAVNRDLSGGDSIGPNRPAQLFQSTPGDRSSATYWNSPSALVVGFDTYLSADDVKSLSDNPWQIFEPEVERIWISDYIATGGLTQVQSDASLNYVLQAVTLNSQGGMYSILGLVNSDINASYNVTESRVNSSSLNYVINAAVTQDQPENYNVRAGVDSTQNETYNILGAVQQSQNEEYNVLASLSSTQGSTYNVRSALSKDQGSTYFISESTYREQLVDYVIRSSQHNDQSATYSILSANSVGNNADLNYVISALIQQDQQENYLVRSSAHQETNGVYTVRSSAESTTEGSYAVRASLTGDATLDYSIRAEVNSSGSMSYIVRASLSKDQGLLYDILAASNVQASSSASYVIQATTANNTTCSYQIQGEVIDLPLTNAEMQQLYAWVGELVTKSATKEEIATAVWSKPTSELTVENSIGKWLMQKVLTVSKFLALK